MVFEIDVDALTSIPLPKPAAVSKFQPMHRDVSLLVPGNVTAASIFDAVAKLRATRAGAVIDDFRLFDVYCPEGAAEKSMAFRLTLSSKTEEALAEDAADAAVASVVDVLTSLGCRQRA